MSALRGCADLLIGETQLGSLVIPFDNILVGRSSVVFVGGIVVMASIHFSSHPALAIQNPVVNPTIDAGLRPIGRR